MISYSFIESNLITCTLTYGAEYPGFEGKNDKYSIYLNRIIEHINIPEINDKIKILIENWLKNGYETAGSITRKILILIKATKRDIIINEIFK